MIGIGATIGDRINRIDVAEGDFVHAGQPLVYLESHAERLAQRNLVASRLAEEVYLAKGLKLAVPARAPEEEEGAAAEDDVLDEATPET